MKTPRTIRKIVRLTARIALGLALLYAGIGHLTYSRLEFQAQVPVWLPLEAISSFSPRVLSRSSGVRPPHLGKGGADDGVGSCRVFLAIFPGNINQFVEGIDAFGLDSDQARLTRLFFQPLLVVWALWSTSAVSFARSLRERSS